MWQFLSFLLLIIIMHILLRTREEQKNTQQETKEERRTIWGFPPLEFPLPEPEPQPKKERPKEIPLAEIKKSKITPQEKSSSISPSVLSLKPEIKAGIDLDKEKLEEAIILSEILGPPKARR
ncbi:MAG: hypothetical protein NC928_04470 [Candidatus Omnitrophica bacterium]|nr:hypothetical protein [Candidatus Omnitrophota bacterium]